MATIEWKKVKLGRNVYRVSREEFPTKIVYTAWEHAERRTQPEQPGFVDSVSHSRLWGEKEGGIIWGAINDRHLPIDIKVMTPRTEEYFAAVKKFKEKTFDLAYNLIIMAYPDLKQSENEYKGQITILHMKPVEVKDYVVRGVRPEEDIDPVKQILAVTDMPNMVVLAELNDVPTKPSDTAGLLKMRLSNALRKILKNGGQIKKP